MFLTDFKKLGPIRKSFVQFMLLFAWGMGGAEVLASSPNRRALVEASFSVLCPALKVIQKNSNASELGASEKNYLSELIQACDQTRLEFLENFRGVQFLETSQERWMGTDNQASTPIFVNQLFLNSANLFGSEVKVFSFVHKVLLHELGHKISGVEQGEKDRLARLFADRLSQFELGRIELPEGELFVFSIPSEHANFEIEVKKGEELQSTFAIVQNDRGQFVDLTKALSEKVSAEGSRLRSIWTEVNSLTLAITSIMLQQIKAMYPQVEAEMRRMAREKFGEDLGPLMGQFQDTFSSFVQSFLSPNVGEIRSLNILGAQVLEQEGQRPRLQLQAVYVLDRSGLDYFKSIPIPGSQMSVDMPEMMAEPVLELPVLIEVPLLPNQTLDPAKFNLRLRPELNLSNSAKLRQVQRSGDRTQVRVRLDKFSGATPQTTHLRLNYPGGHIMVPAQRSEWSGSSSLSFLFEIPQSVSAIPYDLEGESILVDHRKSFLLDRVVSIPRQHSQGFVLVPNEKPQILPGSFALLAQNGNSMSEEPVRQFHPLMALYVVSKDWVRLLREGAKGLPLSKGDEQEARWVYLDQIPVELSYRGPEKVRELRLELMRVISVGEFKPEKGETPISGQVQWGDSLINTTTSVLNAQVETLREFVSIPISNSQIQRLKTGDKKIKAAFALDAVRFSKPLLRGRDYYAPINLVLTQVELVFEDGTSVKQSMDVIRFDPGSCDMVFN